MKHCLDLEHIDRYWQVAILSDDDHLGRGHRAGNAAHIYRQQQVNETVADLGVHGLTAVC